MNSITCICTIPILLEYVAHVVDFGLRLGGQMYVE
jgi:hypothetical protein